MAHIFQITDGVFGLSLTDPGKTADVAVIGDYTAFSCQITSASLEASPNESSISVPATFCDPAQERPQPGTTSYSLNISALQDPDVVNGINRFLFENDTKDAWFFVGFDGTNPPKAIGKVKVVAGTIGGEARTQLTFDASLAVDGKPQIEFGDAGGSVVIPTLPAADPVAVAAGTPGTWTAKAGSTLTIPANLTAAKAIVAAAPGNGFTLPTSAWATGEYVLDGGGNHIHWDNTAGDFATGDAT
jgi:hypothetical protein